MTTKAQFFFDSMWPLCISAGASTGIHPEIIFAQAALETGYGTHAPQNNYFGIKGAGSALRTTEFINGVAQSVSSHFAGYFSMADSVDGYTRFILRNRRYRPLRSAGTITAQLVALQQSGYATDPQYINKLAPIIDSIPALEKVYHSLTGVVARVTLSPMTVLPPPVGSKEDDIMSDLSKFLRNNAGVVSTAANLLTGLLEFAPGVPPVVAATVHDVAAALQQHAVNSQALAQGVVAPAEEPQPVVHPTIAAAIADVATAAKIAFVAPDATAASVAAAVNDATAPHVDGPAAPAVANIAAAASEAAAVPDATPVSVLVAVNQSASAPVDFAAEFKAFEGSALEVALNDAKALLPEVLHDFTGGGGVAAMEQDVLATGGKIAADVGSVAQSTFQPHTDPTKN